MKMNFAGTHCKSLLIAFLLAYILNGCTFGKSCEEFNEELKDAYNSYIDKVSNSSGAELLVKCQKALDKCPDISMAYELMGLLHWENNRMEDALQNYIKAVELAPDDELLLTDAKIVAFESGSNYLQVDENGSVKMEPFNSIHLEAYASSPDENRMQWCEFSLSKREDPTKTQKVVDQHGKTIGSSTLNVSFETSTPNELDDDLLEKARNNPQTILSKATADCLIKGVMSISADIDKDALLR